MDTSSMKNATSNALYHATSSMTQTITSRETVKAISELSDVKCTVGQKTSRVINAICKKHGMDKYPQYNAKGDASSILSF